MTTKQFVKEWMDSHEPDTFIKDEQGRYMYRAKHVSLNLEAYFTYLLEDYIEHIKDEEL